GHYNHVLLTSGINRIPVAHAGDITKEVLQRLLITRSGEVVPVPVGLEPVGATPTPSPTPNANATPVAPTPTPAIIIPTPAATPSASPTVLPTAPPVATPSATPLSIEETEIRAQLSAQDGRRSGSFTDID